jgi:hypothetical protein
MPLQQKRRLNHALFSGIVSFIKRGEDKGEIEIKIRGDGSLKRTWEDLKKENQVRQVRTPGSLGSASSPDSVGRTCNPSEQVVLAIEQTPNHHSTLP